MSADQIPTETGRNKAIVSSRLDLAKKARISKSPAGSGQTFSPESGNGDRTLPDSGGICWTLILAFVIFLCELNAEKYFQKNHFF
jgi:hypothetical protein